MDRQPDDSFDRDVSELFDQAEDEAHELFSQHYNNLILEALQRDIELTISERQSLLIVASNLRTIEQTTHPEERRRLEKNWLANLAISTFREEIRDMITAYFPLEPLTEEDMDLVTQSLLKSEEEEERREEVIDEIDVILNDIKARDGKLDLSEHDRLLLVHIGNSYYDLRFETPVDDIAEERSEFLGEINQKRNHGDIHPALSELVSRLIGDE